MKEQAEYWDEVYSAKHAWRKETRTLPDISLRGKQVLELGVGNGKTLRTLLRMKSKRITAVDFSSVAIEQCKKQFHEKNISFLHADATKLPLPNESIDVAVCYYVLNNMDERQLEALVRELKRVLRPNGIVFFEDFSIGDFREKEHDEMKVKGKKHTVQKSDGIRCHYFSLSELASLFSSFSKIELTLQLSHPITRRPELVRKIIRGQIKK